MSNTTVLLTGAAAPDSPRAQYVASLGATYIQGDVDDRESIDRAVDGVHAVFAVPVGPHDDERAGEPASSITRVCAARRTAAGGSAHSSWGWTPTSATSR